MAEMRAVIGHSDDVDARDAIQAVIEQCQAQLEGEVPKAALLFMSAEYEHQEVLDAIAETWPGVPLIGSTSDGEVSSREGFVMDSVLLTLLCGDIEAHSGVGYDLSLDIPKSVDDALSGLPRGVRPRLALTTFAPSTDAAEVIRQFDQRVPTTTCPLLGGLSGAHRELIRMAEFHGQEVLTDSLPILFLSGDIRASWGIGSGWLPQGRSYEITSSSANIVKEIDGEPAAHVYVKHYGEVSDGKLGGYPVAVSVSGPDGPWELRAVFGTDQEAGELRLAAGVPEGALLRMTEAVVEGVLSGTMHSIREALARFRGQPEVALLFTCAARKWLLGSRAEEEIQTVLQALPGALGSHVDLAGLYVYGEIAPSSANTPSRLHNETCITVLLGAA